MSRIRSIHPGLWTDEAFVSLSPFARLMAMGLWNECDDKGTFPWSPLQMKMRILPADNVDAAALMAEIEERNLIARYKVDGKEYGAVRNFCKFQRPKKPNDIHPITDEMRTYVGISGEPREEEAPSFPNEFPTSGEKSPQREDGGGREGGKEPVGSSARDACERVATAWNSMAEPIGLARCTSITPKRMPAFKARLRDTGIDAILRAIEHVPKSSFLRGDRGDWSGCTIDFLLKPDGVTRILEGKYDDRSKSPESPRDHRDGFTQAIDRRLGLGADGSPAAASG
jgi:hypothetical protein